MNTDHTSMPEITAGEAPAASNLQHFKSFLLDFGTYVLDRWFNHQADMSDAMGKGAGRKKQKEYSSQFFQSALHDWGQNGGANGAAKEWALAQMSSPQKLMGLVEFFGIAYGALKGLRKVNGGAGKGVKKEKGAKKSKGKKKQRLLRSSQVKGSDSKKKKLKASAAGEPRVVDVLLQTLNAYTSQQAVQTEQKAKKDKKEKKGKREERSKEPKREVEQATFSIAPQGNQTRHEEKQTIQSTL